MALAWSTIAVLVLLLPGFIFFIGAYFPDPISRDSAPPSPLQQLAASVLVAFLVHSVLFIANSNACGSVLPCIDLNIVFAVMQLQGADGVPLNVIAENLTKNAGWILSYILISCIVGLLLGLLYAWGLLTGVLRAFTLHKWLYRLVRKKRDGLTYAHVMTYIREQERVLMYKGMLDEFVVSPDGRISYLTLKGCARYYMALDRDLPVTVGSDAAPEIGKASDGNNDKANADWRFLVIEGEDIANVVFERYGLNIDNIKNDVEFNELIEEIKRQIGENSK